jgi:hypothetical protein
VYFNVSGDVFSYMKVAAGLTKLWSKLWQASGRMSVSCMWSEGWLSVTTLEGMHKLNHCLNQIHIDTEIVTVRDFKFTTL